MPQNTTITLAAKAWTQLTDANVTTITLQNVGGNFLLIKGTVGATPPTNLDGALRYSPGQGECNRPLLDLFPGVSGANRIYAWADGITPVTVSHA